ncbi:MAG: Fis family transcriptional regulator [Oleispira sp.]|nr:Fis family transcriptional regulator [Oleispira sp.]
MKKTDKLLENTLVTLLTRVCEQSLKSLDGFQWLTHLVNYKDFPRSLTIICVFDTQQQVSKLLTSPNHQYLVSMIVEQLKTTGIQLPNAKKQIQFDSEEACNKEHAGKWSRRLK